MRQGHFAELQRVGRQVWIRQRLDQNVYNDTRKVKDVSTINLGPSLIQISKAYHSLDPRAWCKFPKLSKNWICEHRRGHQSIKRGAASCETLFGHTSSSMWCSHRSPIQGQFLVALAPMERISGGLRSISFFLCWSYSSHGGPQRRLASRVMVSFWACYP